MDRLKTISTKFNVILEMKEGACFVFVASTHLWIVINQTKKNFKLFYIYIYYIFIFYFIIFFRDYKQIK